MLHFDERIWHRQFESTVLTDHEFAKRANQHRCFNYNILLRYFPEKIQLSGYGNRPGFVFTRAYIKPAQQAKSWCHNKSWRKGEASRNVCFMAWNAVNVWVQDEVSFKNLRPGTNITLNTENAIFNKYILRYINMCRPGWWSSDARRWQPDWLCIPAKACSVKSPRCSFCWESDAISFFIDWICKRTSYHLLRREHDGLP